MYKAFVVFFLCLLSLSVSAQNAVIRGSVVNEKTNQPISGVTIKVEDLGIIQETNQKGEFILDNNIPQGTVTISVYKEGYQRRFLNIETRNGQEASVENILLKPLRGGALAKSKDEITGTAIVGVVIDKFTGEAVPDARLKIVSSYKTTTTDLTGRFVLDNGISTGINLVSVEKEGYESSSFEVIVKSGKIYNIDFRIGKDTYDLENLVFNTFSEDQLTTDNITIDGTSRYYQNSTDLFLNIAAQQFSPTFFSARGQDGTTGKVLINGTEYNSAYTNSVEWNALGGLEEATQNSINNYGLSYSKYNIGGTLGSTNINTRPSLFREGGKVSYLGSNRRFFYGVNATVATKFGTGWSIAASATKRYTDEGFFDGTPYDSNSFFLGIEKQIGGQNSIALTGFFTPTDQSGRSANTQEVFDLKNNRYNSYWGELDGDILNSREQSVQQPFIQLSVNFNITPSLHLLSNLSYNFGSIEERFLDFDNVSTDGGLSFPQDPNPVAVSNLPSAFFTDPDNPDFENGTIARNNFINNGQIEWQELIDINSNSLSGNSIYITYNDVIENTNFTFNTIADYNLIDRVDIQGSFAYESSSYKNFAQIDNLLGGEGYIDLNLANGVGDDIQSDLANLNRTVEEGDTFRYNYNLFQTNINSFLQAKYTGESITGYLGVGGAFTTSYREGEFANGSAPLQSEGKGEEYDFIDYNVKGGAAFNINTMHKVSIAGMYRRDAPSLQNLFINAREGDNPRTFEVNDIVTFGDEIIETKQSNTISIEANYDVELPFFRAKVAGYFTDVTDATETNNLNSTSVSGDSSSFVNEVITGIGKRYMGVELGFSYDLLESLEIKGAATYGKHTYTNNPDLYYVISEDNIRSAGETSFQDLRIQNGPSTVASLGFKYNDEDNWWFEAMGNFYDDQYVQINPYTRSEDFFLDNDGLIFDNFDVEAATDLLEQEKFDNYMLVNLSGGKYWIIGEDNYVGFTAGIHNVFGSTYYAGGFENRGTLKYDTLVEDATREQPLYSTRKWSGYGTTYFLNVFYKF